SATIAKVIQSISFPRGDLMSRTTKVTSCLVCCALAVYLLSLIGCTPAPDPWREGKADSLKVLVTFPPLYCFTKGVAGDDARVVSLLSATGPHEHQANADDAQLAAGADLFLANGLGLDDFVGRVVKFSGNDRVPIVKIADAALPATEGPRLRLGEHGHEHEPGGHQHEHKGEWDPHAWLGIDQAVLMVQEIAKTLKAADPANASGYDARAAQYVQK